MLNAGAYSTFVQSLTARSANDRSSPIPGTPTHAMRIHLSDRPTVDLLERSHDLSPADAKPVGLWWAEDAEWIRWVKDNWPSRRHPYAYDVHLSSDTNLLTLEGAREIIDFTEAFGRPEQGDGSVRPWHRTYNIDWLEVARHYDGIVVRELTAWGDMDERGNREGRSPAWLCGPRSWEVPSGCVWRPGPKTRITQVPIEVVREMAEDPTWPAPPEGGPGQPRRNRLGL